MRQRRATILLILLVCTSRLLAQGPEIDNRLKSGELDMTFPSIYFKHNSTDYAEMPYTADSCFKYIASRMEYLNSLAVWRDSSETDQLTNKRILKLRTDLNKYTKAKPNIQSMGKAQKISQRTIYSGTDSTQIQYLLSLNSVFDVSGAVNPVIRKKKKGNHAIHPRVWCPFCWYRGAVSLHKKNEKRKVVKKVQEKQ